MRTSLCVATLALVVSNAAHAQVVLTEADALARLSADSPRVRSLRVEIDLAKADMAAASRLPNPRLTLNREAVAGVVEDFVLVSQPLPVTGRRTLEARAAEALVRATELRVDDLERRVRAELRLAYATLRQRQIQAQELGATHVAAWSYEGTASMSQIRSARPEVVWRLLGEEFARLRGRNAV